MRAYRRFAVVDDGGGGGGGGDGGGGDGDGGGGGGSGGSVAVVVVVVDVDTDEAPVGCTAAQLSIWEPTLPFLLRPPAPPLPPLPLAPAAPAPAAPAPPPSTSRNCSRSCSSNDGDGHVDDFPSNPLSFLLLACSF